MSQAEKGRLSAAPAVPQADSFFLLALFEAVAIVVVAVPAEKTDIHETRADGYPGCAEIDQSEFFKHVPPSLIGMRRAAWASSDKLCSPALLFAGIALHKLK